MDQKASKRPHVPDEDQTQTGKNRKPQLSSWPPNNKLFENIAACSKFGETIRTTYGTRLRNEIVISHIEKQSTMSEDDATKKIPELMINNPVLKILIEESKKQEQEASGGPIFVIIFSAALLERSVELFEIGLKREDVINFYKSSLKKVLEVLETLKFDNTDDKGGKKKHCEKKEVPSYSAFEEALAIFKSVTDNSEISNNELDRIKKQEEAVSCNFKPNSSISTDVVNNIDYTKEIRYFFEHYKVTDRFVDKKMQAYFDRNNLVALAGLAICDFPVTYLHYDDQIGYRYRTEEATIAKATPGSKTLKNVHDLLKKFDEWFCFTILISIGNEVDDIAKFFIKKKRIMHINCSSRFDLNRISKVCDAIVEHSFLSWDDENSLGYASITYKDDVADRSIAVLTRRKQGHERNIITARTVVVEDIHDDIDPSKITIRDGNIVPGGGATEIELAIILLSFTDEPFDQRLAIKSFADALKVFPRTLAEVTTYHEVNEGGDIIAQLYAAHKAGNKNFGIDTEVKRGENCIVDAVECGIFDSYEAKMWGLICGVNAAVKILEQDDFGSGS